MATMETKLELVQTYEAPEFPKVLEGFTTEGSFAAAVDGVVVASSGEEVRPTASTAKMILALAVMEKKPFSLGSEGESLTITEEMYERYSWYLANNGSNTAVRVGEEISELDALRSVLLASSNNMADSLAIWAFGSLAEYREYATEMLSKMGLSKTVIGVDASGYDPSTVSTAEELAIIGEKVLREPVLAEIVGERNAVVPVAGEITNTNKLLGTRGIIGVKTGYIGDVSGYCLVSGYLLGKHAVTVAVLGEPTRAGSFTVSEEIVARLQEELREVEMVSKGQEVGYYESWWMGRVPVVALETVSVVGYSGVEYEISREEVEVAEEPSLFERFLHVFGWEKV